MSSNRAALVVPLLIVAAFGIVLGFVITRQLAPQGASDAARVSVIAMPTTEPTSAPTPTATADADGADGEPATGSSGRSDTSRGGSGNCPAGCTCESRPPSGVMIVCRGS